MPIQVNSSYIVSLLSPTIAFSFFFALVCFFFFFSNYGFMFIAGVFLIVVVIIVVYVKTAPSCLVIDNPRYTFFFVFARAFFFLFLALFVWPLTSNKT